ncbi:MAG: sulfide/dihydroorotate dehydrogenase-like FAD/NAD-binding protein [Candidatus Omnitrophica bacterium]|nr:sulfide/dihydroorotate dehydrogenase-like FAD/NAD-binding protein [Candidatus Omnitrophota bacterium]
MKILAKEIITKTEDTTITRFKVSAPLIAVKAQPGQFIVVMVKEEGERIPLTAVDKNEKEGSIVLVVQEIGFSTKLMGTLNPGDSLYAIAGPMGHATPIENYGKVILVGGGVGIAEIYPLAKALKEAGNQVITILGARTKELLILEDEMRAASSEVHITTDDGSYGKKGFVTDILKELVSPNSPSLRSGPLAEGSRANARGKLPTPNLVYAVGPIPMMERVAAVTKDSGVKTVVSLNALMVDASGMCGGCRVKVKDEVKFSCVDGPEFDGHLVDWDELKMRSKVYADKEEHICKLNEHIT